MSTFLLFALTSVGLLCMGLYSLLTRRHLLRKIIALNVVGSGIFLLLISIARRNGGEVPDPVPQAMVLTGIVVAVSATALAIALMRRMTRESGRVVLGEEDELE